MSHHASKTVTRAFRPKNLAHAQRLRLQRTYLGVATHGGSTLIVVACAAAGLLSSEHLMHYLLGITVVCGTFVLLILSNLNLRFRDPGMTAAQVILTMWPAAYVMFYVSESQARVPFMLMGAVGVLFGGFALDFRRMLLVCAGVLASYAAVIVALVLWDPAQVDLRIENVSTFRSR